MKINNNEKKLIEEAVREAELKTSGEIVPVILRQSDFYPAAHFRLALVMGVFLSLLTYTFYHFEDPILLIWIQFPGMILGYLLAYFPTLKRVFTTKSEMNEETHQRAIEIFHEHRVSMTKDRTGIILYVSLLERKVEVLADSGINQKVSKDFWETLVAKFILNIRNKKLVFGMCDAISECGKSLEASFPKPIDNQNEISNELITDL